MRIVTVGSGLRMYSLSFKGLGDLQDAIVLASDLKPVKELTQTHLARMARFSNQLAPHKTGFLKRSLTTSIADEGLTGILDYYAEYAPYQEYGTRYIPGKFFLKRAFDIESSLYLSNVERMFM